MATANTQTNCRLFALPAELRNTIYDLVFAAKSNDPRFELKHAHTSAPEKRPLLACRRLYNEAKGIYKSSASTHWSAITFTLDASSAQGAGYTPQTIGNMVDPTYLARITHIEISCFVRGRTVLLHLKPSVDRSLFVWDLDVNDPAPAPTVGSFSFEARVVAARRFAAMENPFDPSGQWVVRHPQNEGRQRGLELEVVVKVCFATR